MFRFEPRCVWATAGCLAWVLASCSPAPATKDPASSSAAGPAADGRLADPPSSAPEDTSSVVFGREGEPEFLMWEDLLPDGEEAALAALYEDYFRSLDQRVRSSQTFLTQSPSAGPISPGSIEEGSSLDVMPQIGTFNTVTDLDGLNVRMAGYIVPFDFDAKGGHREFLFVPYQGACIHTPPPPPNQMIHVTSAAEVMVPDIWGAYWLEGVIQIARRDTDLGDAAYSMKLSRLAPYE